MHPYLKKTGYGMIKFLYCGVTTPPIRYVVAYLLQINISLKASAKIRLQYTNFHKNHASQMTFFAKWDAYLKK